MQPEGKTPPHNSHALHAFQDPKEKFAWIQLIRTQNVGPVTFHRLLERYGTAQKAIEALPDLARKGGRTKPLKLAPASQIEKEIKALEKLGGELICAFEESYPLALSSIEDAPPVISVIGNKDLLNKQCIAIVGARNASLNGRNFTRKLARELGKHSQIIVSGMARGIDTEAHKGAMETGTIAVLAGGVDMIYPRENEELYNEIKEKGLIVAESPLGMQPVARHFPRRNRIVSGISSGTIVVEATLRSGSLITARLAGEQGRDVYAVPGHPLDPRSSGTNRLLADGAILTRDANDVIDNIKSFSSHHRTHYRYDMDKSDYKGMSESAPAIKDFEESCNLEFKNDNYHCENGINTDFSEHEAPKNAHDEILKNLSLVPTAIDELVRACQLTIPEVQNTLLELELAGKLQRLSGNRIVLLDCEE